MRSRSLTLLLLIVLGAGWAQVPPTAQKPLERDQIVDLVRAGIKSTQLARIVRERGIGFEPADAYFRSLRDAGASQAVIDAVFAASPTQQHLKTANVLLDAGDLDGAIGKYREILKVNPGNPDVHRLLGIALGKKGDWQGDLAEQRKALRLRPSDALAKAEFMAVLRGGSGAEISQLEIVTAPQAEVYLDDRIAGRVGGDGRLWVMAKPGRHLLRVSLKGRQDFQQEVTLATGRVTRIVAALAGADPAPAR